MHVYSPVITIVFCVPSFINERVNNFTIVLNCAIHVKMLLNIDILIIVIITMNMSILVINSFWKDKWLDLLYFVMHQYGIINNVLEMKLCLRKY